MTLSDRIKLAAEEKKISQAGLARACGISRPSVNAWFSGTTQSIDGKYLTTAAEFLGVNPHWLATGEGEMQPVGGKAEASNVTAMPAPALRGLDGVLAELQAVVDGLSPLLQDAGRTVLIKWMNGQASRSDAVATLESLQQASSSGMPAAANRAA